MADREEHIQKAEKDFEPPSLTEILEMNTMKRAVAEEQFNIKYSYVAADIMEPEDQKHD